MLGLGLAINGTSSNLQIYLIKQYNVESIDAAQIANIVRGSLNLLPLAGAILSDSYFGYFPVILAGGAINVLVRACLLHPNDTNLLSVFSDLVYTTILLV
jgi:peptide/histidine transporter 3/4